MTIELTDYECAIVDCASLKHGIPTEQVVIEAVRNYQLIDDIFPVLDRLEKLLSGGCYVACYGDTFFVDAAKQHIVSGKSLRAMLVNLAMMDS